MSDLGVNQPPAGFAHLGKTYGMLAGVGFGATNVPRGTILWNENAQYLV